MRLLATISNQKPCRRTALLGSAAIQIFARCGPPPTRQARQMWHPNLYCSAWINLSKITPEGVL